MSSGPALNLLSCEPSIRCKGDARNPFSCPEAVQGWQRTAKQSPSWIALREGFVCERKGVHKRGLVQGMSMSFCLRIVTALQ